MRKLFPSCNTSFGFQQPASRAPKQLDVRCIFSVKLFFQSLANLLRQRWASSACRHHNLQRTAPHHSTVEEVATLRIVHRIAKHIRAPRRAPDSFVHFRRRCCCHN
jgi:hypothetical protein